jgi:hypothetical protein
MNIYRITRFATDDPVYAGTLAEAKTAATRDMARRTLVETRVDLIDVRTDKDSLVALLNLGTTSPVLALRTWKLSPRGALVETSAGE